MKISQEDSKKITQLYTRSLKSKKVPNKKIDRIIKLTGDASTRRYFRIYACETSYVVCLDTPSKKRPEDYSFWQVQNFLQKNGIPVPEIYDIDLKKGYLLEEDLSDNTLLRQLVEINSTQDERDIYRKILDILVKLHKIKVRANGPEAFSQLKFDHEKLFSEAKLTHQYFIKKFLKIKNSDLELKLLNSISKVCEELASQSMVLTHRDFHSRNIMIQDAQYVLIDFQDARLGIPQYDLVSLLEDCYYLIDQENKDYLIKYYWDKMGKEQIGQKNFEEFLRLYDLMAIQRIFKAIGSFCYIFFTRKDKRYLKYVGLAMERLKIILMRRPELEELRKVLFKFYYEN